jgi:hypothetical protein
LPALAGIISLIFGTLLSTQTGANLTVGTLFAKYVAIG